MEIEKQMKVWFKNNENQSCVSLSFWKEFMDLQNEEMISILNELTQFCNDELNKYKTK